MWLDVRYEVSENQRKMKNGGGEVSSLRNSKGYEKTLRRGS